jgi:mercuric ion binding protein
VAQANWVGPDLRAGALVVFGATGDLADKKSTWILGMNTLSTSCLRCGGNEVVSTALKVQEQIMGKQSEIKVKVTGVHLCCQGCVDAVDAAVENVAGVTSRSDMEKRTVVLTARDDAAAQKALDAMATAGFHGITDNEQLAMKAVSSIPRGRVKRLKVAGIHNCCGLCCEAIKAAIATVDGVAGDTATPRATTFQVTGDFHAAALVKALNAAGFSAHVR